MKVWFLPWSPMSRIVLCQDTEPHIASGRYRLVPVFNGGATIVQSSYLCHTQVKIIRKYVVIHTWSCHFLSEAAVGTSYFVLLSLLFIYLFFLKRSQGFRGGMARPCKNGGRSGWMWAFWSCPFHHSSVSLHPSLPCWQQSSKQNSICLPGNSYSLPAQLPPTAGNRNAVEDWQESRRAVRKNS